MDLFIIEHIHISTSRRLHSFDQMSNTYFDQCLSGFL